MTEATKAKRSTPTTITTATCRCMSLQAVRCSPACYVHPASKAPDAPHGAFRFVPLGCPSLAQHTSHRARLLQFLSIAFDPLAREVWRGVHHWRCKECPTARALLGGQIRRELCRDAAQTKADLGIRLCRSRFLTNWLRVLLMLRRR